MTDPSATFPSQVRLLVADARRRLTEHPEPRELLAYHEGELTIEDRDRIQDHLAICGVCARTVLDMTVFPDIEPRDVARRLADTEVADELAELRARLVVESSRTAAFRRPVRFVPLSAALPIAASLIAAIIGLSIWILSLLPYTRPEINAGIDELRETALRGDGPDVETSVRFEAGQMSRTLIFPFFDEEAHTQGDYSLEVTDSFGLTVWRSDGFETSSLYGNFTLRLPRDLLEPGTYRFTLLGHSDGKPVVLANYFVRLEID